MPTSFPIRAARALFAAATLLLAASTVAANATSTAPTKPAAPNVALLAEPQKIAASEGITEYRLANGLRALLMPDGSAQRITLNVTYLVGSRHEGYGETGMAHLLEHLLFKGTPSFPDLAQNLRDKGMKHQGTTDFDRTNYYETFIASEADLRWALAMEADRMVNSTLAQKDLDSEMTVVRNEFERGENSPQLVLRKRIGSVAYDWHNYGNLPIGNRSDVENVDIERLRAFYRRYYQPDNATLILTGKFDEAATLKLIDASFGAIPKPQRELPRLWTAEPTQDGERSVVVRRVGDIQLVQLAYKVPASLHADNLGLEVAAHVLGNAPSGRLHKALVESGKAVAVGAGIQAGVDPGLFLITAVVKKGQAIDAVRDALIQSVESFHAQPPSEEEMKRFRAMRSNAEEKLAAEPVALANVLSESVAQGDWRWFFHRRDMLKTLPAGAAAEAAQRYLRRDNRVVGLFLPEDAPQRAEIPATPSAEVALKDFKPKQALAAVDAIDTSNVALDARTRRLTIGSLKVALLPKPARGETVHLQMRTHAGTAETVFGKTVTALFADALPMAGAAGKTRAELADEMNQLKAVGRIGGGSLELRTVRGKLSETLRFAAQVMRGPAYPESEFEQLRKQMLAGIEAAAKEPGALAATALGRHFNLYPKGDPRYVSTQEEMMESIRALTLDQVREFHRDFGGADVAELAIVGDFDPEQIIPVIEQAFGGWKTRQPYQRLDHRHAEVAPANLSIEVPDKASAVFLARMNVEMAVDDADYPALELTNRIIGGGGGLASRLGNRVRQRDGLSYSIGSTLAVIRRHRAGHWSIQATAAPANVALVERAVIEELERARRDGFSQDELDKARAGMLQERALQRADDGALAGRWRDYLEFDKSFTSSSQVFEDALVKLTLADVNAVLRKYIDPAKLTIVKAGSFAKVE